MTETRLWVSFLWFFCFQTERRIDMPRMSKKRKQEWALFLNERNRITYNELCRKCSNDCKQSLWKRGTDYMKEQKHSYSQRIGKTTFIVNVKQSESAKKPLNTVFQDICKHEVLGGFFTDKSFNLENPQKVSWQTQSRGIKRCDTALATKQSPGLFLPNADAFGASCLLHCVQFTREQAPALRLFMALWQQKRRRGG